MVAPPVVVCAGSRMHDIASWLPLPPSSANTGCQGGVVVGDGVSPDLLGDALGDTELGAAVGGALHGILVHTGYLL